MSAINILGGITYVRVKDRQYALRGDAEVMPQTAKKEVIVGEDGVHGVMIEPMAPSIKVTLTATPDFPLKPILSENDLTVTIEQANGIVWTLSCATVVDDVTIATKESEMSIKFAGVLMNRTRNPGSDAAIASTS